MSGSNITDLFYLNYAALSDQMKLQFWQGILTSLATLAAALVAFFALLKSKQKELENQFFIRKLDYFLHFQTVMHQFFEFINDEFIYAKYPHRFTKEDIDKRFKKSKIVLIPLFSKIQAMKMFFKSTKIKQELDKLINTMMSLSGCFANNNLVYRGKRLNEVYVLCHLQFQEVEELLINEFKK